MEITPSTQSTATGSSNTQSASRISSDFETFLRMLTTQMQNQDPLNPLKSDELSLQLATFSGVEQQVRTNDLLESLGSQFGIVGLSETAGWIGMEARTSAPVHFEGDPVQVSVQPVALAESAELVVVDETGREVARTAIDPTATDFAWQGQDAAGAALPTGHYRLSVEHAREGEVVSVQPVEHFARVTEARSLGGQNLVILEGGQSITPSEVTALRAPN